MQAILVWKLYFSEILNDLFWIRHVGIVASHGISSVSKLVFFYLFHWDHSDFSKRHHVESSINFGMLNSIQSIIF